MVKIRFNSSKIYKNELKKPFTDFLIEDNELDEMVKSGAIIVDQKVANKNKVTDPKFEDKKPKYNYKNYKKED